MTTIYELTAEDRASMKRLIDAGVVVTTGEHQRNKARLDAAGELAKALEKLAEAVSAASITGYADKQTLALEGGPMDAARAALTAWEEAG